MAAATTVLLASVFALAYTAPAGAATPNTVVSLGFDDGYTSQYAVRSTLASHGMHGTFFIISDNVGSSNYMTWSQIAGLASDGNEIAGHTLSHPDLTTLSSTQARLEICGNRNDLLSRGYPVTDFAYPYGTSNKQVEQIVQQCGYNSARTTLWYGVGCGNPCTDTIPPRDPYATTVIAFSDQTLTAMENEVLVAEAVGGFAQIVFHEICNGCQTGAIPPATFNAFLDWLQTQVANGSIAVGTIHDVIGGSVKPLVAPPVLAGTPPAQTNTTSASIGIAGEAGATYRCSLDGATFTACSSPEVLSGLSNGPHTFLAKQTDTAGDLSTAASASWTIDTTVPAAPMLSGSPPALTNSSSASISFTGLSGATDTCSVDGGTYAACSSPKVLTGLADGAHSLAVKQTNAAGTTSAAATASWTVNAAVPAPPVLSGVPPAQTNSSSASVSFAGLSGATYTCAVDGGTYAACSPPKVLSGLSDGPHSLAVRQTNAVGTTSAAATASWTIDTTVPAPPGLSGVPAAQTNTTAASIAFTGLAGATYTCAVDGGTYAACSSPKVLSGLSDGSHSLAVRQTNAFGTTSAAATASWTIDTTIPAPPGLSGVPPTHTSTTTASIGFTGLSGASYACSVDGGTYAACASPKVLPGLADGPHSLAVKQTNVFGTTSAAATASWTVDTTAPAPPVLSSVPPAQTNNNSASIGLTGEGGASFSCSVDGGTYTACSSPKVLTGLTDGIHSLAVKQTDLAGNKSAAATLSWTLDTTVPAPPALSGVPPAQTNTTTASIGFTGLSGASYSCSVDGGPYGACSSPGAFTGLADGPHSLAVKQTNVFGTTSAASTAAWTIDTTIPAPPVLSGVPPAQTNSTTASISLAGLIGASYTCSVDGGPYQACPSPMPLTGLADGPHTLAVKQTNAFGTTSVAATASWTIDTTIPAPPVLSGVPPAQTNTASASIGFTGPAGATYTCSVDGGPYAACSSPGVFTGLADGDHSLAVKQTNAFGTTSAAATASWTVDTTAPAPPVLSGAPPAQTSAPSASIGFTGENGATFSCSIDGGSFTVCTSPAAMTGLAVGVHSLAVTQTDGAGNASVPATAVWTVVTAPQSPAGAVAAPPTVTPPTVTPPAAAPPTATPPTSTPAVRMGAVRTLVGPNGAVLVTLSCPSSASARCQGSIAIRGGSVSGPTGRSGTAKAAAFGRASYTVQPGKRLIVTLHLSGHALKLLARRHTLKVTLVLTGRYGRVIYRRTLTLHAPKA